MKIAPVRQVVKRFTGLSAIPNVIACDNDEYSNCQSFAPLCKDKGLVPVDQNPIFDVPSDGPREHRSLDLSPQSPQVIGGLPVIDTLDILLDFGAILARR